MNRQYSISSQSDLGHPTVAAAFSLTRVYPKTREGLALLGLLPSLTVKQITEGRLNYFIMQAEKGRTFLSRTMEEGKDGDAKQHATSLPCILITDKNTVGGIQHV